MRYARAVGVLILILLTIPIFWAGVTYALRPRLYEGDELVERACRQCGGTGVDAERVRDPEVTDDRCVFCRGSGTVDVIVPGPNRPTRLWGVVVDRAAVEHPALFQPRNVRGSLVPSSLLPEPIRDLVEIDGTIAGADVTFTRDDGEIFTVRTNSTGRFSIRLVPGTYRVEVRAPGFQPLRPPRPLRIRPLTGEVWLERATLVQPVDPTGGDGVTPAEARSTYGLDCALGVSDRSTRRGFFRVWTASYR